MLISAILLIATYYDLRSHEIPAWLTLTVLFGSGASAIFLGLWIPVLLIASLCLILEMEIPAQRRSFAAVFSVFAAIFASSTALICLSLLFFWFLWDMGYIGGADMKLIFATLLAFGSSLVLIPILLVGGFQGLIALFRKQTTVPYVISIFIGTLLYTLSSRILI